MLERMFAALARVVPAPGDDLSSTLAAVAREVQALVDTDIVVLRLPAGSSDTVEVRVPEDAGWPPARLFHRWATDVATGNRPVELAAAEYPRRPAVRQGIVLPILPISGRVGALGLFSTRSTAISPEQCAVAMLLIYEAIVPAEAVRLRDETEAIVAREIHDGPLQMLSGMILHLRLMRAAADQKTNEVLGGLETQLEQAIKQMRGLIRNLRVAHPEASLEERIRGALARLEQTRGLSWSLEWRSPETALENATGDEVFQIINEALANVYRHSSAKRVDVVGRVRGDAFEITVRDDGVGFDVSQALRQDMGKLSFGLINMRERVSVLGGSLVLRSQPGRGTRVLITLPLSLSGEFGGAWV